MADIQKVSNAENESSKTFERDFEDFYKKFPLTDETKSGIWIFKGPKIQKLASKKFVVALVGLTGCLMSSTFSYFGGTLTTMEKRFKMSNKTIGIVLIGNDISKLVGSIFLSYYTSHGHRPRWIAVGLLFIATFCFLNVLPFFIYGPGSDALQLTVDYGTNYNISYNQTEVINRNNHLCASKNQNEYIMDEEITITPFILFISQIVVGFGSSFYRSLTISYLDDNIKKAKSPVIFSFIRFSRIFGPALGYTIVSICLKLYIDPTSTPIINNSDPRWLGAWWIGWLILGPIIIIFAVITSMMPKNLPRSVARREFFKEIHGISEKTTETKPSLKDLIETLKRLLKNKIYTYTMLSSIFCLFGHNPYKVYFTKYIEVQYNKTASAASFITGTTGLFFTGIGILIGGIGAQKIKPKARSVILWITFVDVLYLTSIILYSFLGCDGVDRQMANFSNGKIDTDLICNANCECDFVKFSPVCSLEQNKTYISACHAGCTRQDIGNNGIIFSNCSCLPIENNTEAYDYGNTSKLSYGLASSGTCAVDCQYEFYLFIFIKCVTKMFGAMSNVSSFLLAIRCVKERDKSVSLGFSSAIIGIMALLPSPIFFGYIIDSTCLIWGKTRNTRGNCWFYNTELLRKRLSYISALFLIFGIIFDLFVAKHVKDLNIFNDNIKQCESEKSKNDE